MCKIIFKASRLGIEVRQKGSMGPNHMVNAEDSKMVRYGLVN